MNRQTTNNRTPDLSLTCRTSDLELFVALGLAPMRTRSGVTDLELAVADHDLYPERCRLGRAGIPFYGFATTSIDQTPVVFASEGHQHFEAPAGRGRHPAAHLYSSDPFPHGAELALGRLYYRCLANTLAALSDPNPWLPAMPKALADAMACSCGGRGWVLAEEEDTHRFFVCRCDLCEKYQDDAVAGAAAYGVIEAGWPE
jgi:hypothetical protein